MTPLAVMLELMREYFDGKDPEKREKAAALARHAAPYVHGKVSPARGGGNLAEVPDDELEAFFGDGEEAAEAGPDGTDPLG